MVLRSAARYCLVSEDKQIHRPAPAHRAINLLRFSHRAAHRPVVEEGLPADGRQRMARHIIVVDFMIVPHHIGADFGVTALRRGIVAIDAVFLPELGQCMGRPVAVGVNRIAQMEKEVGPLSAHRVHHRKRLVALARVAAKTENYLGLIIRAGRRDKACHRPRLSALGHGPVIIPGRRLQTIQRKNRAVIRAGVDGVHLSRLKLRQIRLLAVSENHATARVRPQPHQRAVGSDITANVAKRQAGIGIGIENVPAATRRADEPRHGEPGPAHDFEKVTPVHVHLDVQFVPNQFAEPAGDKGKE